MVRRGGNADQQDGDVGVLAGLGARSAGCELPGGWAWNQRIVNDLCGQSEDVTVVKKAKADQWMTAFTGRLLSFHLRVGFFCQGVCPAPPAS